MRALLIWGCFTLCILAVAVSSSDPSESGRDEGPQRLAALVGKENGGRREELSDWLADSPSVADDTGARYRQKKKKSRKPTNTMIGRSLFPPKDEDEIKSGDCNLMPPKEEHPFDTSSRKYKRERRSVSGVQPPPKPQHPGKYGPLDGKIKVKRSVSGVQPPPKPQHPGRYGPLERKIKVKRHNEDGHGRHQRHGKKRDEERRGRKHECKPKEEESTKTLEPELSSVDGQVKEKRRHRGQDRERGHRERWRSGSTSSIAIVPPSSGNMEPGDRKPWWTERSRKRRQNDKNRKNRPRPGWGGAIAGVKQIKV
ncbi:uncharacterized protein [Hyperolius riggenbachi]|uniref:uncharacterized protein isoform X2 n=1 Tax=Hyperolius riggenbachi TaxID=752182 RepID=UPI0035A3841C